MTILEIYMKNNIFLVFWVLALTGCGDGKKGDYKYVMDCKKMAEHEVRHPSTVKHKMSSDSFYRAKNGNIAITIGFSAKNSFGAEIDHKARCIFPVDGNPEITIQ